MNWPKEKNQVAYILMLGILIREIFSFWTGHPTDFELWVRLGYAMNHGGNPYSILPPAPGLSFANVFSAQDAPTIAYLPFWPIITGLIYDLYSVVGSGNRFAYYFFLKQPVIFGDVGLAYLLYRYVSKRNPQRSTWVLLLWLMSPLTIIISGIWGTFDSIAMAFVMVSVISTSSMARGFWTGLGTFAKSVPMVYAVPTTLRRTRDWRGLPVAIGLPALSSVATVLIMGWPIHTATLDLLSSAGKGGLGMSIWDLFFYFNYLGILPSLTPNVYQVLGLLWIPLLAIFTVVAFRNFGFDSDYGLIQSLLVVTLAFLIFKARVTEQYSIYLLALSAVDVAVWHPKRRQMLMLTMVVTLAYLVTNNYFLIRFLSPVYPKFNDVEVSLYQAIGPLRYAIGFLLGGTFTCLNVKYLFEVLRPQSRRTAK